MAATLKSIDYNVAMTFIIIIIIIIIAVRQRVDVQLASTDEIALGIFSHRNFRMG